MDVGLTSSPPANRALSSAKAAKQDEFYTQLPDIERELKHYKEHFRGKTILCNCDDPFESNFFKYFAANFKKVGLRSPIDGGKYATQPPKGEDTYGRGGAIAIQALGSVVHTLIYGDRQ